MLAGLIYALAAAFDLGTTSIALHLGLHEGNPFVAPMINQFGIIPQIAVSAVLCGALYWYSIRGGQRLVYALAAIRWMVVASNLVQLGAAATIPLAFGHVL
jgi:uncharacterized membrane protein